MVLCAASSYEKKYFLDPFCDRLPQSVKDELKIMCTLFVEEVGGVLTIEYDETDESLYLRTHSDEGDLLYDEVGSGLLIKKIQNSKQELLESLELYCKTFLK
ncbi:MAG: DUF6145 family protein [Lachnospiraceae bacterium]|nr:DUF6145 family protein [Lachnospiraceae bacterium]